MTPFYLASQSPRRLELLAQVGLSPRLLKVEVPETPLPGQTPHDYALETARAKARAGAALAEVHTPVLAADTDVSIDGRILGKPRDKQHGVQMLSQLSGRWHEVFSAVVMRRGALEEHRVSITRVRFGVIHGAAAARYWESGEAQDKAGAYAIQGYAARWVAAIEGSYTGVVGLPLFETCDLLTRFGILAQAE